MNDNLSTIHRELYRYQQTPNEARLERLEQSMAVYLIESKSIACATVMLGMADEPQAFATVTHDGDDITFDGELLREVGRKLFAAADALDAQGAAA